MSRRKQPAALATEQVLDIFKVHWRATETSLAAQMRERGVQAVVDSHGPMMTALFEVNPSGVFNKTFLRDVATQWCQFHSLPWTPTEVRQEAYALKVLQKRVLSTARNTVAGTRLPSRLRTMSSRLRCGSDPSPAQHRRRLSRKTSAEQAAGPAPRSRAAASSPGNSVWSLYGLEPPRPGPSARLDDEESCVSVFSVDTESDSQAENFETVFHEGPQGSPRPEPASPSVAALPHKSLETPPTRTQPDKMSQSSSSIFFDTVSQRFARVCATGQTELGETKPDGKGFMLLRWPGGSWEATEHTEIPQLQHACKQLAEQLRRSQKKIGSRETHKIQDDRTRRSGGLERCRRQRSGESPEPTAFAGRLRQRRSGHSCGRG